MTSPLKEFLAWLSARGISGPTLAVYEAGAERLLALAGAGPVLPKHVDSAAAAAQAAGAAPHGVSNLRKIGTVLLAFQKERPSGKPVLVYCDRCKMSHDPAKNPAGCPYCRSPGFIRRMRQAQKQERHDRDRREAFRAIAVRVAVNSIDAAPDALALGLDIELPDSDVDS